MNARRLVTTLATLLLCCSSQIQHGLEERDANEVISALTARGFTATKVPEKGKKPTYAIEVDDEHAVDAMRVLTELKLPRAQKLTTQKLASEQALIETPQTERLRQLEAEEGDLEQALESVDGVTSASVELVVPPTPRPGVHATPSKAAVLLRVSPDAVERLQQQRAELRALVAGAVEGLTADDVVLVLNEVQSPVPSPTLSDAGRPPHVIVGLGALIAAMALALVLVVLKLRVARQTAVASPQPSAPPKPVVAANVQRKAA